MSYKKLTAGMLSMLLGLSVSASEPEDPFIWLEEVEGEKALNWVREQNAISLKELEAYPEFKILNEKILVFFRKIIS